MIVTDNQVNFWKTLEVAKFTKKSKPTVIRSVQKALSILDLFLEKQALNVTEISGLLGLSFSTTHHLVSTIRDCGYLRQDKVARKYRLGPKAFQIGIAAQDTIDLVHISRPILRDLASRVNENVNLAVLDHSEIVYIAQASSMRMITMFTRLGARAPLHCTGVGKVLLAYMDMKDAKTLVDTAGYQSFTRNTITEWYILERELREIKLRGYAVDREEREEGVFCVAVPVMDFSGEVCAALSISGPVGRIAERVENLVDEASKAAKKLSIKLGFIETQRIDS